MSIGPQKMLLCALIGAGVLFGSAARGELGQKPLATADIGSASGPLDLRPQILEYRGQDSAGGALASSPLGPEDAFYVHYLSRGDVTVARAYYERWRYHDLQTELPDSRWGDRHVNIGSLEFYNSAPTETSARRAFAEQALRIRLEGAFNSYSEQSETIHSLQRAKHTIEGTQSKSVRLSKSSANHQLHFAYNPFTDVSKAEYSSRYMSAGVYYSVFHSAGTTNKATVSLLPSTAFIVPSASYRLSSSALELALTRRLSSTMQTSLTTVQPTRSNTVPSSVGMSLSCRF